MEQEANSISEFDEICWVNLRWRLPEFGLLYKVGGIIGERLWLFSWGSCKYKEINLPLESRTVLATDSVGACSIIVSSIVRPSQLVKISNVLFAWEEASLRNRLLGNGCTVPDLAVSHFNLQLSCNCLKFTRLQASALQMEGNSKTSLCLLRLTDYLDWTFIYEAPTLHALLVWKHWGGATFE